MSNLTDIDLVQFQQQGFVVTKVFSPEEVADLRQRAYLTLRLGRENGTATEEAGVQTVPGDLLSKPLLRSVILDQRILALARKLLGQRPVYFGDSSFQIASVSRNQMFRGQRQWHKDNRVCDRTNPDGLDWQGEYPLIRFGLYLQDHARHSGGLGLKAGSHQSADMRFGKPVFADSGVGDVVAWNMRASHVAQSVRVKFLPGTKLRSGIEDRLPEWMTVPQQCERAVLFFTFGARGDHLERYSEYLLSRDYFVAALRSSPIEDAVWDEIRDKDIEVMKLIPEYGSNAGHPAQSFDS